jgi:hypothetical protein
MQQDHLPDHTELTKPYISKWNKNENDNTERAFVKFAMWTSSNASNTKYEAFSCFLQI